MKIHIYACVNKHIYVYIFIGLYIIYQSIYLSVCLSIYLSIYLSFYLSNPISIQYQYDRVYSFSDIRKPGSQGLQYIYFFVHSSSHKYVQNC